MNIGILAVQGAVFEHEVSVKQALSNMHFEGIVNKVKSSDDIYELDGLIIPGGESSTISRLIDRFELRDAIMKQAGRGMNIMGTCAGSILLAKKGDLSVDRTDTELLGLMDMKVIRNSFGRQRESFESIIDIDGIADDFPGVFIRAPSITDVWGGCNILSVLDGKIVAAEQENNLAFSFHPELTPDTRVHQYFLKKIASNTTYKHSKNY